jgi:AbrB family looped-hinge helix DNA binding protein
MGGLMELIQVRKKSQITLPATIRQALNLEEGDILVAEVQDGKLVLQPKVLVDKSQAWFWSPAWQAAEREADEDLTAGRYDEFATMDDLIADLHRQVAETESQAKAAA